jgi:UDP-N-acetylglucosamine 4,6-dehydratase
MALTELGRALDPNVRFREIGIRPGEKLHEMLIGEDDARRAVRLGDSFVIAPEGGLGVRYASLEKLLDQGGTRLADGFRYSSDSNDQWLSAEQLRAQLIRSGMLEAVCVP